MTQKDARQDADVLWRGHPWILPSVIGTSVVAIVITLLFTWLELRLDVASFPLLSLPLILWSYLFIFLIWLVVLARHLLMRASDTYVLRRSSLEVESGIAGKRSAVLAATGFSDLQVTRTISGRILKVGNITVRSDSGQELRMKAVHDPVRISSMVRDVMSTPIVRLARESLSEIRQDSGKPGDGG